MVLQLDNGNLDHPLGSLEDLIVISCGIEYEHTFDVVDFGQDSSYEMNFERSFMPQLMVI